MKYALKTVLRVILEIKVKIHDLKISKTHTHIFLGARLLKVGQVKLKTKVKKAISQKVVDKKKRSCYFINHLFIFCKLYTSFQVGLFKLFFLIF